jgi:hypothetical protein
MKFDWPKVKSAQKLEPGVKRLYVGAYGFEFRSLGWVKLQSGQGRVIEKARLIKYLNPKGKNLFRELKDGLSRIGAIVEEEIEYDTEKTYKIEQEIFTVARQLSDFEEIIVDTSAMTKLAILCTLMALKDFSGVVRIIHSSQKPYTPSLEEYTSSKDDMSFIARFPSQGVDSIVRTKSLSSIRMQGQPITLVAFTSFNEQLIRHVLGTITPHRLIFINGIPDKPEEAWRESAMQAIHQSLIDDYAKDNVLDANQKLKRAVSLVDYRETVRVIDEIYNEFGAHERIICVATGSKMQTVGLFFGKLLHSDIHIEYPTPNSYFRDSTVTDIGDIHECEIRFPL